MNFKTLQALYLLSPSISGLSGCIGRDAQAEMQCSVCVCVCVYMQDMHARA